MWLLKGAPEDERGKLKAYDKGRNATPTKAIKANAGRWEKGSKSRNMLSNGGGETKKQRTTKISGTKIKMGRERK